MRAAYEIAPSGRVTTADRLVMEAGIAALEGRRQDARRQYAEAQRTYRDLGAVLSLLLTDVDMVVTGSLEADERDAVAHEARTLAERLGTPPLMARLERALSAADRTERPHRAETTPVADEVTRPG